MTAWVRAHSGALTAGLSALLGTLALVVVGNESFADITAAEWLIVLIATDRAVRAGAAAQAKQPPPVESAGKHAAPSE